MGHIMMMCTSYISNYYSYDFFIKFIDNKKLEKNDNQMCTYVKRYSKGL
jgi:hypothetical protein